VSYKLVRMGGVRWLDEDEERAWRAYRQMRTLLDLQIARDLARDSGLAEADYDVLSHLSEARPHEYRVNDLAERMRWSKSRLSHQLTRMEQRGLVTREECAGDARGATVALTPAGSRTVRRAAPDHVRSVRRHFIDLLSSREIKTLSTFASRIADRLSGADMPDRPSNG